jgi:hypothetical protein
MLNWLIHQLGGYTAIEYYNIKIALSIKESELKAVLNGNVVLSNDINSLNKLNENLTNEINELTAEFNKLTNQLVEQSKPTEPLKPIARPRSMKSFLRRLELDDLNSLDQKNKIKTADGKLVHKYEGL